MRPAINRAVMQQRRAPGPADLDFYPTPPFATRALCEFLQAEIGDLARLSAWEPACGEMHMARPLAEYFGHVRASDCHRYRAEHEILDFTLAAFDHANIAGCDFVITNPPFRLAQEFIERGLLVARRGVAMLVRSAFLEGQDRHAELFSSMPPSFVLQFVERVVMLEGRLVRKGAIDPGASEPGRKASTATSYCWLILLKDRAGEDCRIRWIPPSFHRLERPGDYPALVAEVLPPCPDGLFAKQANEINLDYVAGPKHLPLDNSRCAENHAPSQLDGQLGVPS